MMAYFKCKNFFASKFLGPITVLLNRLKFGGSSVLKRISNLTFTLEKMKWIIMMQSIKDKSDYASEERETIRRRLDWFWALFTFSRTVASLFDLKILKTQGTSNHAHCDKTGFCVQNYFCF